MSSQDIFNSDIFSEDVVKSISRESALSSYKPTQINSGHYLYTISDGIVSLTGEKVPSGFLQIVSSHRPKYASQPSYTFALVSEHKPNHTYRVACTIPEIYDFFSINLKHDISKLASPGMYSALVQQLAKKYKKNIDTSIDWDKIFKGAAVKESHAFGQIPREDLYDILGDSVLMVVNDDTMQKYDDSKDPIYYFAGMLKMKLKTKLSQWVTHRSREIRQKENSEVGEEQFMDYVDNSHGNEEIKDQRAKEESMQFEYLLEDFKDYLHNVPGEKYMLGIIDGMLQGKTNKQIAAEWKPNPVSPSAIAQYNKRLIEQLVQYSIDTEDTYLYQLAKRLQDSRTRSHASAEDMDIQSEKDMNLIREFLQDVEENIDKIDVESITASASVLRSLSDDFTGTLEEENPTDVFFSKQASINKMALSHTQIRRCTLDGILSDEELIQSSFQTGMSASQKQALDQQIYDNFVKDYTDVIEEDSSLYGLKAFETEAPKPDFNKPVNVSQTNTIPLQKESPEISLNEASAMNLEGTPNEVGNTDFFYDDGSDEANDYPFPRY